VFREEHRYCTRGHSIVTNPYRKVNGEYTEKPQKKPVSKFEKYFMASCTLFFIGLFIYSHINNHEEEYVRDPFANIAQVAEAETLSPDRLEKKIAEMKKEVLDTLKNCESPGRDEAYGLITYDQNEKGSLKGMDVWSIGKFQFKIDTVIGFVKARDGKTITQKEAIEIALSEDKSTALAEFAIFNTPKGDKGVLHWYNCAKKHNLEEKVAWIKKLEK